MQNSQMQQELNYNWLINISNNIDSTLPVNILHYLNLEYLWKLSNYVSQSLHQELKKQTNKKSKGRWGLL